MDQTPTLTTGIAAERLLRRLEWRVVRRLDGRLQGDYRSLFRGTGIDFVDLREYEPGDDLRHIEWNVTARMDTPYVREFVEERELTAWLLLDHSASMGFGPVDRQKDLVLAEIATTLARVLTRGGNRVGAIMLGPPEGTPGDRGGPDEITRVIPPRSGRDQVLVIAKALLERREAASREPARDGRSGKPAKSRRRSKRKRAQTGAVTDLSVLLRAAQGLARRRSLLVVISDFISSDGWQGPLAQLARRHEVVALQVTDPREVELPSAGMIYVEDAETGEQIFVDTDDPAFRARLRQAADDRQAALEESTRSAGVDFHQVATDEDLVRSLVRIAALRRNRRR